MMLCSEWIVVGVGGWLVWFGLGCVRLGNWKSISTPPTFCHNEMANVENDDDDDDLPVTGIEN